MGANSHRAVGLDTTKIYAAAKEKAQRTVDRLYPPDQVDIRARKLKEFTDMYYREMAFP